VSQSLSSLDTNRARAYHLYIRWFSSGLERSPPSAPQTESVRVDLFDDTIRGLKAWLGASAQAEQMRRFRPTPIPSPDPADGGRPSLVLGSDTHLELGHPSLGSCSVALTTLDSSLINDGLVTLIGPDIRETGEKRLPFAQIVLASLKGEGLTAAALLETASSMDRAAHLYAQGDGYMVRSLPHVIWARISKDAAQTGFSLEMLGGRLLAVLREKCPTVSGCEVLLVTRGRQDIDELNRLAAPARDQVRQLETFEQGPDGEYECTQEQDCGVCPEQVVCNNVRDVIKLRKGDRIVSFGEDRG